MTGETQPAAKGVTEAISPAERVDMVSYEKGYKEKAEPIWRLVIDGYCADFPTETAANNFRAAILAALSLPAPGDGEPISEQDPRMILAGIRQFGLASDGSDLRDLEAAIAECASDGCNKQATVRFERGGVGSYYCHGCYMRIQAIPQVRP